MSLTNVVRTRPPCAVFHAGYEKEAVEVEHGVVLQVRRGLHLGEPLTRELQVWSVWPWYARILILIFSFFFVPSDWLAIGDS
ncbi:hypothetical protein MN608_09567 [Microdochium nivale]|nr:hypothetical protein MN608_09567 [Microdochium nivale]